MELAPERLSLKTGAPVSAIKPQKKEQFDMKHLKIAGLCLVSTFAMGMALAGNASATPSWLLCLPGTGTIEYENNQCITEKKGGGFISVEAATTDPIEALGFTLTLKDSGTALGTSEVQCWGGRSEGYVGPGNKSVIRTAEVQKPETLCKGLKVCESSKVKKVEGLNLPWTEALETGTENIANSKVEGTGGGAGWKVTCDVALVGEETDECTTKTGEEETASRQNRISTNGILLILVYLLSARKSSCTLGNSTSGSDSGQAAELGRFGGGLSIIRP